MQLLRSLHADAPEPSYRQRMQKCEFTVRRYQQQAVGLGLLAGHLGQELGACDADSDREPYGAASSPGVPAPRHRPDTSRNASSTDSGSTTGEVSWNTSNTASLAWEYADIRGGTTIACGHSWRAWRPPLAVRTPYAFAS